MTKYWCMRELSRDKGRLEDIVEYPNNVLSIIEGVDFERFEKDIPAIKRQVEKYLNNIDWDKYLEDM